MKRITLLVIALWAMVGSAFLPLVAQAETLSEITLEIRADIDGRSQLILSGNTAQWQHFDFAAPGRHEFSNSPTTINGVDWFPVWPDIPDAENRGCNCFSDIFMGVAPALPMQPMEVELEVVSIVREDPEQPDGTVAIVQYPTQANNFTLIIEFDDNAPLGSAFYMIRLHIQTAPLFEVRPSHINPRSHGVISVAIFTTPAFDATTVDPTTVRLGGAAPVRYMLVDMDDDGDLDLLLHFRTQDTDIACGDTSVTLTGETFGEQAIANSAAIQTVGCQAHAP